MNGDLFGGRYTSDEVIRIMNINARPSMLKKPFNPMYKKTAMENAPSWREKREVIYIANKTYFNDNLLFSQLTNSLTIVRSLPHSRRIDLSSS